MFVGQMLFDQKTFNIDYSYVGPFQPVFLAPDPYMNNPCMLADLMSKASNIATGPI